MINGNGESFRRRCRLTVNSVFMAVHNGNCVTAFCLSRSFSSGSSAVSFSQSIVASCRFSDFPSRSSLRPVAPRSTLACGSKGASTAEQSDEMLFHQRRNYKMVKQAHHITRPSPFQRCKLHVGTE